MNTESQVACPCCDGKGEVTAERIQELLGQGHHVQAWGEGGRLCWYCDGAKRAPSLVVELVPLHDFTAVSARQPFANREECVEVLDRLEKVPWFTCRDEAWASAACLLAKAEFDRSDLPGILWQRARPFLAGRSLGRILAAEVAMGLFDARAAIDLAFTTEHPRAADVGPIDSRGPYILLWHHDIWLRPEQCAEVAEIFAKRLTEIPDAYWRGWAIAQLLIVLARKSPEILLSLEDRWFELIGTIHDKAFDSISQFVLPQLASTDVERWIGQLWKIIIPVLSSDMEVVKPIVSAIAVCGDSAWSWDAFQMIVNDVRAKFPPVVDAADYATEALIDYASEALVECRPQWHRAALELLLDCYVKNNCGPFFVAFRTSSLGAAIFVNWREPYFEDMIGRLISHLVGAGDNRIIFNGLTALLKRDPVGYHEVLPQTLKRFFSALSELDAEKQIKCLEDLVIHWGTINSVDLRRMVLDGVLAFLDRYLVDAELRPSVYSSFFGRQSDGDRTSIWWDPADVDALFAVTRCLNNCSSGPHKLIAIQSMLAKVDLSVDDSCRERLDVPEIVLVLFRLVGQLQSMMGRLDSEERLEIEIAGMAWTISQYRAPLPLMNREDFESILTPVFRLPRREIGIRFDNRGMVYCGVPLVTCLAAIMKRFAQIGDGPWRIAILDRVLTEVRETIDLRHRQMILHAIIEALGAVELSDWHKEAMQKLVTYAMSEEGLDLSILKRGMVTQFVRLGEFDTAEKLARTMANHQLRSEALAEIARGLAQNVPEEAVALLREVVSPEVRGKLAVDLAAIESLSESAEMLWTLLETVAEDPVRLQEITAGLLAHASGPEAHELLTKLGWEHSQRPQTTPDPLATILDELVAAECIASKKRDRILSKMSEKERSVVQKDCCRVTIERLVSLGHLDAEEVADLLLDAPNPNEGGN